MGGDYGNSRVSTWGPLLCAALVGAMAVGLCPRAEAVPYAVVFSGGYDRFNNHDRYYEETLRMWNITRTTLGIPVGNIYVLFADGTAAAIDRSSGVSSDWSMIVAAGGNILAGTAANLQSTLTTLGDDIDSDDCFYFWSFDHGSNDDPPVLDKGSLVTWGSPWVSDEQFEAWTAGVLDAKASCFAFAQCFAGDLKRPAGTQGVDYSAQNNISVAWAATWNESSWGQGWADAWADGLEAGIVTTHALGQYAVDHDIHGPNGTGLEHPGWAGADINLITNEVIPEPATMLLLASGALVAVIRRRRAA